VVSPPISDLLSVPYYRKKFFLHFAMDGFLLQPSRCLRFRKTFPKQIPFFSRPGMGNWRHANVAKCKVHFGNLYRRLQPFPFLFRWTSYFKGLNLSNLSASLQPPHFAFQYLYSEFKVFSEFTYEHSATNRRDLVAWCKVMLCFYLTELKKLRYLSMKIIQRNGMRKLVYESL
jgi:hypothetical protein